MLGHIKPGTHHDKKIFDDENWGNLLPSALAIWLDRGFQGVQKDYPHLNTVMAKKKPKGKKLTEFEKDCNKIISRVRIVNEHAFAGVKRYGSVTHTYRNKGDKLADEFMVNSCGLWNYHLETRRTG